MIFIAHVKSAINYVKILNYLIKQILLLSRMVYICHLKVFVWAFMKIKSGTYIN